MQTVHRLLMIFIFLLAAVPAFGVDFSTLPPQVQVRRYLTELKEAGQSGDNARVAEICEKVLALPGVVIDPNIRFYYAKSLFALGKFVQADRELTAFLKAGNADPELADQAFALAGKYAEEVEKEFNKPAWLGITLFSSPAGSIEFGHDGSGVFVAGVLPAHAAGKAGVKVGDLLISYNNTPIKDDIHLVELVAETKPETRIPVTIIRGMDKRRITIDVDAEARPANTEELYSEYDEQNNGEVFKWISDNGFAFAFNQIGDRYRFGGRGYYTEALKWYRKNVDAQGPEIYNSMHAMAMIHHHADGPEKNIAEAIKWYNATIDFVRSMPDATDDAKDAAANSMFQLGRIYGNGDGVSKDIEKAIALHEEMLQIVPVSNDYAKGVAYLALGDLYKEKNDSNAAKEWYVKAGESGIPAEDVRKKIEGLSK